MKHQLSHFPTPASDAEGGASLQIVAQAAAAGTCLSVSSSSVSCSLSCCCACALCQAGAAMLALLLCWPLLAAAAARRVSAGRTS
jgi:hypothetical protein